jgi:hypothetical protein
MGLIVVNIVVAVKTGDIICRIKAIIYRIDSPFNYYNRCNLFNI